MNLIKIHESEMIFGSFQEDYCFQIEKSKTYTEIQNSIKIAEFLLLKPQKQQVWIIEAKKSSPRPETKLNFDKFVAEIGEKMTNALILTLAMCLKRHSNWQELPNEFKKMDLTTIQFKCILVIKGHQQAWLPPLQDALQKALRPTIKILSLAPNSVVVINDTKAKELKIIL